MKSTTAFISKTIVILLIATTAVGQKHHHHQGGSERLLRHVVIFKFKDSSSPADVQKVVDTFMALKGKVPQIVAMEWGVNNSPEHYNEGFTHCFTISYRSEKDLADYQENPAHKAFQEVLKPHMEKVFVVDYWANK